MQKSKKKKTKNVCKMKGGKMFIFEVCQIVWMENNHFGKLKIAILLKIAISKN